MLQADVFSLCVIASPLLLPVAAILQLFFPVMLRVQMRAYRWAISAVFGTSTILIATWLLGRFWPAWTADWLPPGRIAMSLVMIIASCTLASWALRPTGDERPRRLEWVAFAVLFAAFAVRPIMNGIFGRFNPDISTALGAAAAIGLLHLAVRQVGTQTRHLTTQRIFLTAWCLAGTAIVYEGMSPAGIGQLADLSGDWPTFRANPQRTGSLDPTDSGPIHPHVLWHFRCLGDAQTFASPALVGSEVILVATQADSNSGRLFNRLYRIEAKTGRLVQSLDLRRAGVSSPAARGRLIVLGEGYHEDRECRLLVVDRASMAVVGSFPTASHVESSPTMDGNRAFFGAGQDGIFSVALSNDGQPTEIWHVPGDHIDAAPLVAGGRVFAGSVVGDDGQTPALMALDAETGTLCWRVPAILPAIAAPAYENRQVFFALGNGKLNRDDKNPLGALVCLDAATGDRRWRVESSASFYASPACSTGHLFVVGGDGLCRCLRQTDGGRVWQTPLGQRIVASPVVSGGAVFVATTTGLLVRLNATTGHVEWRFDGLQEFVSDGDQEASPFLSGGRLYVAAGGHLFCIGDRER